MKKLIVFAVLPISLVMFSCGGGDEENDETTEGEIDSTSVELIDEEDTELAFDGVAKEDYMLYGHTEIEPAATFTMEEMMTEFNTAGEFNDMVTVNIDQVCQKAGCWITFKDTEDNDIRVVLRDHFTIPIETAQGTEAILMGSLISDTISVDMQKHYLDDAKETGEEVSQEEYDAIIEDKIELSFDCESILVKQG